jgi:methionyl aminopeptidase
MIFLKTASEIETMARGGKILGKIKKELAARIVPGATGKQIDQLARQLIIASGAEVSFAMEPDYHWATCIDINDGVVHGIPTDYRFCQGDIVGLDVGLKFQGFHTDTTIVIGVGTLTPEKRRFLDSGKCALNRAIAVARPGRRIADISRTIADSVARDGFTPVKALSGHGIGRSLHEDPLIPCLVIGDVQKSPKIELGMVLAIEVIYTAGSPEVAYGGPLNTSGVREPSSDGWTIVSLDGKIAAAFEETVAITEAGPRVLTR